MGVWSVHGPLLSWPAAFLSGTTAASGTQWACWAGVFCPTLFACQAACLPWTCMEARNRLSCAQTLAQAPELDCVYQARLCRGCKLTSGWQADQWRASCLIRGLPATCAGFALIKTVGSLGSFAGPALIGALADTTGGFAAPCLLLAACALAGAAMLLGFRAPGAPTAHPTLPNPSSAPPKARQARACSSLACVPLTRTGGAAARQPGLLQ